MSTFPNIKNKLKSVCVAAGQRKFKVDFINEIDFLNIKAKYLDDLIPLSYSSKFDLKYFQQVRLFKGYTSIDECLDEIFVQLESDVKAYESENLELIIKVPLPIRACPEIVFPLKINQKNEIEKYEDLREALYNMKKQNDKEVKELKEKIANLERILQIKSENVIEKEEKFGTKIEIFNIGKDEYYDYFPKPNQIDRKANGIVLTLTFECKENDVQKVVETFNQNIDIIKKIVEQLLSIYNYKWDLNIRSNKNIICVDCYAITEENEKKDNPDFLFYKIIGNHPISLFPFMTNKIKAILRTEATLVDLFELYDQEKIDNLILNTKLDFEGMTIKSQIFMSFLILLFNNNKYGDEDKAFFQIINDIFLTVINGKCNYKLPNKDIFFDYEKIKPGLLGFIREIAYETVNLFKDPKLRPLQNINFNKIKAGIIGSPKFQVGYVGVIIESPKLNEFIDKVFSGKILKI